MDAIIEADPNYAVIQTGGKQYRVKAGDELFLEKLEVEEGQTVTFDKILAIGGGDDLKVGLPLVDGATVTADVVEQSRHRKVIVFKKKRRKGYQKKRGHRQHYTRVKITEING